MTTNEPSNAVQDGGRTQEVDEESELLEKMRIMHMKRKQRKLQRTSTKNLISGRFLDMNFYKEQFSVKSRLFMRPHVQKMVQLPRMKEQSEEALKRATAILRDAIDELKRSDERMEDWNLFLVHFVICKLDEKTRQGWKSTLNDCNKISVEYLLQFLSRKILFLEMVKTYCNKKSADQTQQSDT